jgi:hypothetical protein
MKTKCIYCFLIGIFLLAFSDCQDTMTGGCGIPAVDYNTDLRIYIVDDQGVNLIESGAYDPSLYRWQVKHDGRYHPVIYTSMYDQFLYKVEDDESSERGKYISSLLYDRHRHEPTELRVDQNDPKIEYWTSDILLDYNYFDRKEREDTLRSVIRYRHDPDSCPIYVYSLEELYINGRMIWKEGVNDDAPEWTAVLSSAPVQAQ